ncbi:hypothetical protein AVEN_53348-1 [Araneus ventricosus]|uniref:Uncharacterized protein n=1 Tax=Araneus ventricosus TaxID=182803 RepID=A0A4Y2AA49_ARAVE|nr:hypothetical protein AVEN_53348-1 [Araneus ventricosus]
MQPHLHLLIMEQKDSQGPSSLVDATFLENDIILHLLKDYLPRSKSILRINCPGCPIFFSRDEIEVPIVEGFDLNRLWHGVKTDVDLFEQDHEDFILTQVLNGIPALFQEYYRQRICYSFTLLAVWELAMLYIPWWNMC